MEIIIYAICDPTTYEVRYIGKTNNLKRRMYDYTHNRTSTLKEKYIEKLKLKGKVPIFRELETCNELNWKKRERYYIKKFKRKNSRLLNSYKGIFREEDSDDLIKNKMEFNELLINSKFYRLESLITLQVYWKFEYVMQLENGIYCLVYDDRRWVNHNGYFHIYLKREANMPIPTNWTGASYEYAKKHNLIMRYSIPKKHNVYKMDLAELPIIKNPISCNWQKGIIEIQP